jgi:hypothetical protein
MSLRLIVLLAILAALLFAVFSRADGALLIEPSTGPGYVTFRWDNPTLNDDGSPCTVVSNIVYDGRMPILILAPTNRATLYLDARVHAMTVGAMNGRGYITETRIAIIEDRR